MPEPRSWHSALRLPLALGGGLIYALGQAPFDLCYVAILALISVFALIRVYPKSWISTGWAFGLGYFGLSLGWIVEPFQVDAAATGWMAPFALIGIAAGLALFWAMAFWSAQQTGRFWHLVPFWAAAELLRAYVLTGFPWGHVAYVWAPSPAIQWVSLIGAHGLGLATLALAAFAGHAVAGRLWWQGIVAVLAGFVLLIGGFLLQPPAWDVSGRPVVRLVQPNAPQTEKWDRDRVPMFFDRQVDYTAAPPTAGKAAPSLIVWPETALPMLLENAGDALFVISQAAGDVPVVLGIQRSDGDNYYNSLIVTTPDGSFDQLYDKHHLVPFGEYMPVADLFARFNVLGLASRAEGGYSAGDGPGRLDLGAVGTALPLICYEAVFAQDVYAAGYRPDLLLQITNDAWFGSWSGPYQHLAQARIRAIEQGLPLVRAANTGVSAVIDGGGRVLASLPLNEAGYLDWGLPAPEPATIYSRTGDLPVFLLLFLLIGGALLTRRRDSD
ncbi:apolipoprotein N-acyltransferase [Puniceibacterium sp. IMCC21224]|uniref:apolipoprotein N-acyltransferase n=1 Tax=Puniceibacterium sp. IMCC21224 TaxID=1618204 RepID=UPI00065CC7AE|nr:apolipoprotein N-acyltransferase [Puniceibacterium sp. IMCC21224]KMK68899.1 Apolipoprotein N-acyltransferase [Puniceibacterium sp. IMCC21224]